MKTENPENFGVIFDFDGTLIDSVPIAYKGMRHIFEQSGLTPPSFEEYYTSFGHPYCGFFSSRGVTASDEQMWAWYHEKAKHEEAQIFDDVLHMLALLHALSFPMAIVSGQRKEILDLHCESSGIKKFFKKIVGPVECKVEEIQKTVELFGLAPRNVFYVGDFASDMKDAIAAEVIPVGITRGYPIRENLERAGARYCIGHLEEFADVVDGFCQTSQPA